jgi:hypothetical protein
MIRMLGKSDKNFWHRYADFYDKCLENYQIRSGEDIIEIGVKDSESIRMWRKLFPDARITGIDLYSDENWYRDTNIEYVVGDQSDENFLATILGSLNKPKLVIDDGSHHPIHQLIFLDIATQEIVKRKDHCIIILEDIHSSLQQTIMSEGLIAKLRLHVSRLIGWPSKNRSIYASACRHINSLSLILNAERCKNFSLSSRVFSDNIFISSGRKKQDRSILVAEELVIRIFKNLLKADKIEIYQRCTLPHFCWRCKSIHIDPGSYRCMQCGQDCFSRFDSMTAVIYYKKEE